MSGCSLLGAVLQLHSASLHVAVGLRPINVHIKIPTPASRVGIFHMSVCTALLFHIRELRIIRQPYEFNGSDRAVSLFGDDDFSDVFLVGVFVVIVVSVEEHNHVGILLDGSGFSEVGQHRTVVGTLLYGSGKLRQGNYRDVEFSGHGF